MNNLCLLPVQAIIVNERGKFHRERRAVKERMLREVGVRHAAIDLPVHDECFGQWGWRSRQEADRPSLG